MAPGCNVWLIRNDLTTILCEVTASIRERTANDEDTQLGVVDLNPDEGRPQDPIEKEILICLRPVLKGKRVSEHMRLLQPVSESSNATCSDETPQNNLSSNKEEKSGSSTQGKDSLSNETQ